VTSLPETTLEVDELLAFTLRAISEQDPETALGHVKALLDQRPDHAHGVYLLAALHAEIGLYGRAIEEMQRAVALDPEIWVGHFQLGMLQLRAGDYDGARAAWQPLEILGDEDPLYLFQRGLCHFLDANVSQAKADLERGIALNTGLEPLNPEMAGILSYVESLEQEIEAVAAEGDTTEQSQSTQRRLLLSRYLTDDA
jgi:tetratricopeptide (TPR) repeat protein